MKNTLILSLAASTLLPAFSASAQNYSRTNNDENFVEVIVGDKDAAPVVQEEFIFNSPVNRKVPGLPRFAIVGNENKFYLGIGAQFLGEAVVDFGDNMPSAYSFTPSSMTRKTPGNGASTRFTAQTSSIYLNFVGMPGSRDRVGLYFNAQFNNGDNYGLKVNHFYAKWRGFTAGWTNSIFEDGAAIPFTIDDEGPNGSAELTTFTLNWTHNFTKAFSAGIGIDAPTADMTTGVNAEQVTQRIPTVPAYLQLGWGKNDHFRVSALVRPLQYRNLNLDENKTLCGWGVQASGLTTITNGLTFYYDATYGRGISDYLQDDNGLGLDAVPHNQHVGRLNLLPSLGLTAGVGMEFSSKLSANVTYSHLTNWKPDNSTIATDNYRYGDYAAANVIYNIDKIVSVGMEYDYGHTKDFAGSSLNSSRIQAQLAITF